MDAVKMNYTKGFDQQITFGLRVREFECRCGYPECQVVVVDGYFIPAYKKFRYLVGVALHVQSGYRCSRHNLDVGGVRESTHTKGQAIDVRAYELLELKKFTPEQVIAMALEAGFKFVKYYADKGFFHMDVTERP